MHPINLAQEEEEVVLLVPCLAVVPESCTTMKSQRFEENS